MRQKEHNLLLLSQGMLLVITSTLPLILRPRPLCATDIEALVWTILSIFSDGHMPARLLLTPSTLFVWKLGVVTHDEGWKHVTANYPAVTEARGLDRYRLEVRNRNSDYDSVIASIAEQ